MKTNMKPIREWFKELPPVIRDKIIHYSLTGDSEADSMCMALYKFRPWSLTDEGHDFWQDVFHAYLELENLEDLMQKRNLEELHRSLQDKYSKQIKPMTEDMPTEPSLDSLRNEDGDREVCYLCASSMKYSTVMLFFKGEALGCIQPKCSNYYRNK